MLKIKVDGYTISQAKNNHVAIYKDNQMVFHGSVTKKLNKEELKKQLDFYLWLIKVEDNEDNE